MLQQDKLQKSIFQKLYDFFITYFITPVIKAFNWLRRIFGRQASTPQQSTDRLVPQNAPMPSPHSSKLDKERLDKSLAEKQREQREQRERQEEQERQARLKVFEEKKREQDEYIARKKAELERLEQRRKIREQQEEARVIEKAEQERIKALKEAERAVKKNNKKALYEAISQGNVDLAKSCLDKIKEANPEKFLKNPSILLYKAIESGHLDILKLLMKYGVCLEFICAEHTYHWSDKYGALCLAIKQNHIHIVKFLLEQGVSIKIQDINAAYHQRQDEKRNRKADQPETETIFRVLLNTNKLSFKFDSEYDNDRCYFIAAIEEGHIETIKNSLKDLDPNQTMLYQSILFGSSECDSIIELAIYYGKTDIAQLLMNYYQAHKDAIKINGGYNEQRIFYCALRHNNIEIVKRLLDNPNILLDQACPDSFFAADYKYPNPAALYYACLNENTEMAELLLDKGATLGKYHYSDHQVVEVIDKFARQITTLYYNKLNILRKSLESSLPTPGIRIVSEYAELPEIKFLKP